MAVIRSNNYGSDFFIIRWTAQSWRPIFEKVRVRWKFRFQDMFWFVRTHLVIFNVSQATRGEFVRTIDGCSTFTSHTWWIRMHTWWVYYFHKPNLSESYAHVMGVPVSQVKRDDFVCTHLMCFLASPATREGFVRTPDGFSSSTSQMCCFYTLCWFSTLSCSTLRDSCFRVHRVCQFLDASHLHATWASIMAQWNTRLVQLGTPALLTKTKLVCRSPSPNPAYWLP